MRTCSTRQQQTLRNALRDSGHGRGLQLPDALVLAAADALDADVLTCDGAWRQAGRRVRVI
jgi:PIN domain nuclease of toxin-antitoxin system